jgi:nucleoside-diphosphate-sugar epimerase
MSRYLVTGGAGFIGSHMVDALVTKGKRVRVLDNFSTGKRRNLSTVSRQIELIEGDVRDEAICRQAMGGVEAVIHLAALHEVVRTVECPMETHEVNVTGTLNLLIAARDAGVKRFVFASSSAVYGDNPVIPRTESLQPSPISSPYAVSKLAGEHYCQLFSSLYGLETVCLRFFNVYGPRQDAGSAYAAVIPKFIFALLAGTPPTIFGDGEQSRDFTFIGDCVAATLAASEAPGLSGTVLNIGTGKRTTVNQLCAVTQQALRTDLSATYDAPQPGDVLHDQADIERAKTLLRYQPHYDLLGGLQETIEAMRLSQVAEKTAP